MIAPDGGVANNGKAVDICPVKCAPKARRRLVVSSSRRFPPKAVRRRRRKKLSPVCLQDSDRRVERLGSVRSSLAGPRRLDRFDDVHAAGLVADDD
jgi:hypothetical protein